jgi:hypothetical protein
MPNFSDLNGCIIYRIDGLSEGSERVEFFTSVGNFTMQHRQDCCEAVSVKDICGDVDDLINSTVFSAEETSNTGSSADSDSATWTFYHIKTQKGVVTIQWLGESNGYYSESVDFDVLTS